MTELELPERGVRLKPYNDEMSKSFVDYGMSVIVARALPDVRDGLKPVHRRIIYAMNESGYTAGKAFKKSARVVGDVIGKYHPHGDQSVYDAMVRLGQFWSIRDVLIDSQGNFGSIDGDPPAAMRYTEARMSRLAMSLVADLRLDDRRRPLVVNTVPFQSNYDGTEREPTVLPARFPNLLVNGQIGIAVGMATNIPTHNLHEAINACLAMMTNPDITLDQILEIMPGPDFPTRGIIMGRGGIRKSYETGQGSIVVSGVAAIEDRSRGRQQIVISEIPYLVNKEQLVTKIAELVNEKVIEGVTDVRDESDREQFVRIVVDVKQDADAVVVLNAIRKMTQFQTSFPYNFTCLNSRGQPGRMSLLEAIREFIQFRRHTVRARTQLELDRARAEQIKQIGLYAATFKMDEIVRVIRASRDADDALVKLMAIEFPVDDALRVMILESDPDATEADTFFLSEFQAGAILDMRLRSLTAIQAEETAAKVRALQQEIRTYLEIMSVPTVLDGVVTQEMLEIREKHGTPRLTQIQDGEADDIDDESLIERKDVVVTLTNQGYVKRTEVDLYRAQRRGGKGRQGMETKDEDFVVSTVVCNTRTHLLAFTSKGQAYLVKTFKLPEAGANAKGRPIVNFVPLQDGDRVTALLPLPDNREEYEHKSLIFVTSFATIRRNRVTDFLDMNKGGKIAMKLDAGDGGEQGRLINVLLADDNEDVLIATANGSAIRYPVTDVRLFAGRDSVGVRAISLKDGDKVVSASVLTHTDATLLEREIYLAGGTSFVREGDLKNEAGEMREIPASIELVPAPDAERPDRLKATLSPVRMMQLRAEETMLLSVSELGYGKRTSSHEYRVTGRGGTGVTAAQLSEKTGRLVALIGVLDTDGLVLVTDGAQTIRTRASEVSITGRSTRGVRLLGVPDGEIVAGVARVQSDPEDDGAFDAEETTTE